MRQLQFASDNELLIAVDTDEWVVPTHKGRSLSDIVHHKNNKQGVWSVYCVNGCINAVYLLSNS